MTGLSRYTRAIAAAAAFAVVAALVPVLPALAGTTGSISGTVTDGAGGAPVAGAKVSVLSPSQSTSTTTDQTGRYAFVSLAPDEYTISVDKDGYDGTSVAGIAVFADATQVVPLTIRKSLRTIARVTSRSAAGLVRSGTTADVYSVNSAQQERLAVLGGGGNLNSAYSAIASVPGAYVPSNQNGYNQAVHVRGGDASEVGYEFDGIPVNRGFDNYPSGSGSALGQNELQVYTGATPADAEAQGLAGFINQVIKSGTYPGYGTANLGVGSRPFITRSPSKPAARRPDRLFNYYVGIGGYNQDHRYIDQQNGQSLAPEFGPVVNVCPTPSPASIPSCFTNGAQNVSAQGAPGYILGPIPFGNDPAGIIQRTSVLNFHFGIPHKHDGGHDDVQLLYDNDAIQTPLYVSPLDQGLQNFPYGLPTYTDSYQYTGMPGTFLPSNGASLIQPYFYPSSPPHPFQNGAIPLTTRDVQYNDQAIVKLQYQKNFGADSFLRLYGYTYYSDYVGTGAVSSWQPYTGLDSGDYELNSHTRGVSASFTRQFSQKHLVQLEASYVTATSLRMNNTQMYGSADAFAALVNPNDLTSGTCYSLSGTTTTPTTCNTGNVLATGTPATFASLANSYNGPLKGTNGEDLSAVGSLTCGSGPCALYTVENGAAGKYNTVKPNFSSAAITDEWRPSDKLLINLGLRMDRYQYVGDNTTATPARAFWFNAFNNDTCFNNQTLSLADKSTLESGTFNAATPCSAFGNQWTAASLTNVPNQTFTYDILQPRIGATLTLNPDTVLRASYGKYTEQPSAAYSQYDALQQNLPDQLVPFYALGFNTPGHQVRPAVSYNADFSYERHFKGTDMSVKISPFLRQTHDQIENFYLNIQQGFVSGLNAGNQTSSGFEFAFQKGDFARDGLAAQVSFAYTNAYLTYNVLPNHTTILSPINADIQKYNAYTSYCVAHATDARCGSTTANVPAAACYAPSGTPDPACATGDIANPYWNAPVQALLDPNGKYLPYSTIPGGIGTGVNAYNYPYVATLILNYKHKRLAITPSLQFVAGNRYGAPETTPGIDPAAGCAALPAGVVAGDPRYPYGAGGGVPYDATTCASTGLVIPDPYTGHFDNPGEFREPSQLLGHLRLSYEINNRVTANVTFANLISTCFGGQQTPFTYYWSRNVCSYGSVGGGLATPVGNAYNPGDNVQTILRYPYEPAFATYNDLTSSTLNPFSVYVDFKIKL